MPCVSRPAGSLGQSSRPIPCTMGVPCSSMWTVKAQSSCATTDGGNGTLFCIVGQCVCSCRAQWSRGELPCPDNGTAPMQQPNATPLTTVNL